MHMMHSQLLHPWNFKVPGPEELVFWVRLRLTSRSNITINKIRQSNTINFYYQINRKTYKFSSTIIGSVLELKLFKRLNMTRRT